ncbi:hypothetical protein FRB96_008438 [Tulasnella sp. 330]|nr:hypothetical protein FRB96_008438 [Tulasnella sp. 330]
MNPPSPPQPARVLPTFGVVGSATYMPFKLPENMCTGFIPPTPRIVITTIVINLCFTPLSPQHQIIPSITPEAPSSPPRPPPVQLQQPTMMCSLETIDELPAYEEGAQPPEYGGEGREIENVAVGVERERSRTCHVAEPGCESEQNVDPPPSIHLTLVEPDLNTPPVAPTRPRLDVPRPIFRIPIIGREPDGLRVSVAEAIMTPTDLSRANSRHGTPEPFNGTSPRELEKINEVADREVAQPT